MLPIFPSLLGAVAQEVLHWYDLKQDLGAEVKLTTNPSYWLITFTAILLFGFTTPWLLEAIISTPKIENWHYFIGALAYPAIVKKVIKVLLNSKRTPAARATPLEEDFELKNYFR